MCVAGVVAISVAAFGGAVRSYSRNQARNKVGYMSRDPKVTAAGIATALCMAACSALPTSEASLPDDATISVGWIADKARLADVPVQQSSSGTTIGVGGGGLSGSGVGGEVLGAGISFDISHLFSARHEIRAVETYRYRILLLDGVTRGVDSSVDVSIGQCVNVIDSKQRAYPRLVSANGCPR